MSGLSHMTDPHEFEKFHENLTKDNPGYIPWYFLLARGLKDPVKGIAWKQLESRLTFEEARKAMRKGNNIGIAATNLDPLCIVDVDDITVTPDEIVKPTLSTTSRKRIGHHYFYTTSDPLCKVILPTDHKGEIRSNFGYVVAPGSFVLCDEKEMEAMPEAEREAAGRYTVKNARSPNTIEFRELPPVFLEQAKKNKAADRKINADRKATAEARKAKRNNQLTNGAKRNETALFDLVIDDIVSMPNKERFGSFFHGSETGKNTSRNDNGGLTCWRHNVTHTPLSSLAVLAGVADCLDAGQGVSGGTPSCIDYHDSETVRKMWEYAKQEGILPKDDPMPPIIMKKRKTAPPQEASAGVGALEAMGNAVENKVDTITIASHVQETNPIIFDKQKRFWVWDDSRTVWHPVDETDVFNILRNVAGLRGGVVGTSRHTYLQAIKLTGREVVVKTPPKEWIAFADCVIDIKTGEQFPATKEYMFTNPIPHAYGDSTDTPTIDRLFVEWVGEDSAELLHEIIGYCLFNDYPIHRVFLLLGGGRNGKSQYLELVERFLGPENTMSTEFAFLINSNFETARLQHKKAVIMGETEFTAMNKTSLFKKISGNDSVRGEIKYGGYVDFKSHATMLIAANSVPPSNDKSIGYGSRWTILDFPNTFEIGKPIIDTIPEWEYENLGRKAVGKLCDLLERGKFYNEGNTTDRAQLYEQKSNPVQMFIDVECDVGGDLSVSLWEFVEAYEAYQEEKKLRKLTKRAIKDWFKDRGYEVETKHVTEGGKRHTWAYIYGVNLKKHAKHAKHACSKESSYAGKTLESTHVSHVSHTPTNEEPPEPLSREPKPPTLTQSDMIKCADQFFRTRKDKNGKPVVIGSLSADGAMRYVPDFAEYASISENRAFTAVMEYGRANGWL